MSKKKQAAIIYLLPSLAFNLLVLWFLFVWRHEIEFTLQHEKFFLNLFFQFYEFIALSLDAQLSYEALVIVGAVMIFDGIAALLWLAFLGRKGKLKFSSPKNAEGVLIIVFKAVVIFFTLILMFFVGWIFYLLILCNIIQP